MTRPKGKKLVPKKVATKRKCKTTRKRTKANAIDELVDIPPELLPKKESKWKKAAKIALGLAAGAGGAALGYYGYKNRDKIKKSAMDTYDKASKKAKSLYDDTTKKAKDYYGKGKKKISDLYSSAKSKVDDLYNLAKEKVGDLNTDAHIDYWRLKNRWWREDNKSLNLNDNREPPLKKGRNGLLTKKEHNDWLLRRQLDRLPLAITDGSEKIPREPPLPIMSGQEMDVVKELDKIKSEMQTTNRISPSYLDTVLREYWFQAEYNDPFCKNRFKQPMFDLLDKVQALNETNDDNSKENYKKDIETYIDTLVRIFFSITRRQ